MNKFRVGMTGDVFLTRKQASNVCMYHQGL